MKILKEGALSKLLQKGTVAQYQSDFEKLMNRVTDVSEGFPISFYIPGLKPAIQRELLVSNPTSLGDAFFSCVTEARLNDQATLTTSNGLLELAGYYRRFIKNFATVAAPLSHLLQKQCLQWGDMKNKAFQDLKARLSEASILGLPDFEDMFIVEADASYVGFDFVIEHKTGAKNLVANALSRVYDEADDVIAAFMALSQPLVSLVDDLRKENETLDELKVIHQKLERKEHKTGAKNLVANALLRVYDEADDVIAAFMALSQPLVSLVDDLRKENETLDELKVIHQKLERKEVLDGFRREQWMILFHDRYFIGAESKLKSYYYPSSTNTSMAGHSSVKNMLVGMSALFY
nr:hypothetical protein [Tanacetum cinerariifolium]